MQPVVALVGQTQQARVRVENDQEIEGPFAIALESSGAAVQLNLPEGCTQSARGWLCSEAAINGSRDWDFSIAGLAVGDALLQASIESGGRRKNLQIATQYFLENIQSQQQHFPQPATVVAYNEETADLYLGSDWGLYRIRLGETNFAQKNAELLWDRSVTAIEILPSGEIFIAGEQSGILGQGVLAKNFGEIGAATTAVAMPVPSGTLFAVATQSNVVLVRDSGEVMEQLDVTDTQDLVATDLGGDGEADLVLRRSNAVEIWALTAFGSRLRQRLPIAATDAVAADLNHDGLPELLVSRVSGGIAVYRLQGDRFIADSEISTAPLQSLAVAPDGIWAISVAGLHRLYAWPFTGQAIASVQLDSVYSALVLAPEEGVAGALILSRGDLGAVRLQIPSWDLTEAAEPESAKGGSGTLGLLFILMLLLRLPRRVRVFTLLLTVAGTAHAGRSVSFELCGSEQKPSQVCIELQGIEGPFLLALDDVDVTEFMQREDKQLGAGSAAVGQVQLLLRLPYVLEPGEHVLVLYQQQESEAQFFMDWALTIPEPDPPVNYYGQLQFNANGSYQADSNEPLPEKNRDRSTGDGSVATALQYSRGRFAVQESSSVAWNSEEEDPFSLVSARLDTEYAGFGVSAGDLATLGEYHPALVDSASRRGVAVSYTGRRGRLASFAVRAAPLQGFRKGLGLGDKNERGAGLLLNLQPWQSESGQVRLALGQVNSRLHPDYYDPTLLADNRVSNIAADIAWKVWTLNASYARSETDYEFQNETAVGNNYNVMLSRVSEPVDLPGGFLSWQFSLGRSFVGTYYDSALNLDESPDLLSDTLQLGLQWGMLSWDVYAQQAHDNVEELPIGRVGNALLQTGFSLSPQSKLGFLGQPQMSLRYSKQEYEQLKAHPDAESSPVDQKAEDWEATVQLYNAAGNWDFSQRINRTELPGSPADGRRELVYRYSNTGWPVGSKVLIQPDFSYIDNRFRDETQNYQNAQLSLNISAELATQGRFDLGATHSITDYLGVETDSKQTQLNPSLSWDFQLPARTVLSAALNGFYDLTEQPGYKMENWLLMLSLSLNWGWEMNNAY